MRNEKNYELTQHEGRMQEMLQNAITRVLWFSSGCGPSMSRRLDGRDLVVRCGAHWRRQK